MTTPVQYGHPDFQRTTANADIRVLNNQFVVGAVTVIHGRFFVGTTPSIHVLYSVNAGGARLTASWFGSETGADLIGTQTVDVLLGQFADGTLPALGPYVELSSICDAAGRTVNIQVWQTTTPATAPPFAVSGQLINVNGTAVGAGVTRTDDATQVCWGWGHWNARLEGAASTRILLLAVDYLGNVTFLDYTSQVDTAPGRMVMLPRMPVRVTSFNNTAAPAGLYLNVSVNVGPW